MIKYETINNQLCRMVEPTPLQLDSPMPCVVRYIQDCSPMGRYMKRKYAMVINTVAIVSRIGTDGRAYSSDKIFIEEVEVLEIIGYPVADGSAEWALYQIRTGKKVVKEGGGEQYGCSFYKNRLFYLNGSGCLVTKNAIGLIDPCSDKEFLDLDKTGWQLYEEKPETAKEPAFAVGNWVTDGVVDGYIAESDNGIAQVKKYGISYSTNVEHLRKLSPSEVVLDFGSGIKGRIRNVGDGWIWIRDNESLNNIATIDTAKLTEPMQTTVSKLLAAIEEEKKKQ
jgi:hypothetical protein